MSDMPNNQAAAKFLEEVYPDGPWVLTSVQLDRKAIETRTFSPDRRNEMLMWIDRYNGVRNIYWSINPPMRDISKKAEREDIAEVAMLHVDLDARAGEDLAAEKERILALLGEKLPAGIPAPSIIVQSGGGYQAFWRLEQPIPIGGDLERAEDAKRYNQQLERLLGGDNCHNIDRIARLPGTVNIPDAKKMKKGRVRVTATTMVMTDVRYPLTKFAPAPAVQMQGPDSFGGGGGVGAVQVKVSGNIPRLDSVEELNQWDVPDRVKVIVVQGRHPEEPKQGDNSRSAWVFDCVCQLVRCEVPDDIIFSLLTDPEFGISESVLEMGANAAKYAVRQIERAKEEAVDPWLRTLNERYAVIGNIGGKCRVVEEVMDYALKRSRLTRQSFDDFRNRHMNQSVAIGKTKDGAVVTMPVGKWWLLHPKRRQFDTIVFLPGQEVTGAYNLWKGFACEARPGECGLYLDHLRNNVCSGDDKLFLYLIGWMARLVQHPDTPGSVAIVLRGGRGVGKSFMAKELGKLFGRHFLQISNGNHLTGNFNSHLRDVVLLFADEAFFAGDKKHEGILKTLITEETITIEAKGVDAEAAPNYVHLIMASNEDHVVPAGGDERRFLVLDVGKEQQQQSTYFRQISEQMEAGGREALLHHLMTYDLTGYEVRDVPQTGALDEQKKRTLGQEAEWWYNKLQEGNIVDKRDGWPEDVLKEELADDYINMAKRLNYTRRGTKTTLGFFLKKVCPGLTSFQRWGEFEEQAGDGYTVVRKRRAHFYKLPTLPEARARWEELYGAERWAAVQDQTELPADGQLSREPPPF